MDKNPNIEKQISIPLFIPVIIIISIMILFMNINSSKSSANSEEYALEEKVVKIQETREQVKEYNEELEEKIEVVEEPEKHAENVTEDTEPKTVTYSASNGNQYDIIATLNIPSLGIKYPILSTTSESLLKISLNKYWGANPNEVGNMVVIGHNYENTRFFSKLPNIKIGDIVKITDLKGKTLEYEVYETDIIDPYDNSCTSQLTNGETEITLITCYNKATQRFIAKAKVT